MAIEFFTIEYNIMHRQKAGLMGYLSIYVYKHCMGVCMRVCIGLWLGLLNV